MNAMYRRQWLLLIILHTTSSFTAVSADEFEPGNHRLLVARCAHALTVVCSYEDLSEDSH